MAFPRFGRRVRPAAEQEQAALNRKAVRISALALGVSVVVGIASIYLPHFWKHHRLQVTISGFYYLSWRESMSVDLVFANCGNQHESVLGASFALPLGADLKGSHWSSRFDHVRLAPISLAPGQIASLRLEQSVDSDALLEQMRALRGHPMFPDADYQYVALDVSVLDKNGLPRRHLIPLARASTLDSTAGTWEGFRNVVEDTAWISTGIIRWDLLKGGVVTGREVEMTPFRYETGVPGSRTGDPVQPSQPSSPPGPLPVRPDDSSRTSQL